MLRTLILILAGSAMLAPPLTAQECCAEATAEQKAECANCSAKTVAGSSASALAKGICSLQGKMWECDIDFDAGSEDGSVKGKIHAAFASPKIFSLTVNAEMANEFSDGGSFEGMIVSNGKEIFIQQMGMGQPAQTFKVQWALLDKMLASDAEIIPGEMKEGLAMFGIGGEKGKGFNPTALDSMLAAAGVRQVDNEDGVIRLFVKDSGEGNDSAADEFGLKGGEITIDLDPKTFFPKRIHASKEEEGTIKVSISSLKFHAKQEGFGEKAFVYTAPEGIFVMDVTPMIEMQLQAAGGGGGDEEELEF